MNRISIRHGSNFPIAEDLKSYELGIATFNNVGILCSSIPNGENSSNTIQTFGVLCGEEAPEEFFKDIENIPDGTVYYHIKTKE